MNKCLKYSLINTGLGLTLAVIVFFMGSGYDNFIFIPDSMISFFLTAYMICRLQYRFNIYPFLTGLATGLLSLFFTFILFYLSLSLIDKSPFQDYGLKEIIWGAILFTGISSITLGWASIALITLAAIGLFDRNKK